MGVGSPIQPDDRPAELAEFDPELDGVVARIPSRFAGAVVRTAWRLPIWGDVGSQLARPG